MQLPRFEPRQTKTVRKRNNNNYYYFTGCLLNCSRFELRTTFEQFARLYFLCCDKIWRGKVCLLELSVVMSINGQNWAQGRLCCCCCCCRCWPDNNNNDNLHSRSPNRDNWSWTKRKETKRDLIRRQSPARMWLLVWFDWHCSPVGGKFAHFNRASSFNPSRDRMRANR